MGTSTSYGGSRSGLIPSWIDDPVSVAAPGASRSRTAWYWGPSLQHPSPETFRQDVAGAGDLRGPRASFTNFASTVQPRASLGSALSQLRWTRHRGRRPRRAADGGLPRIGQSAPWLCARRRERRSRAGAGSIQPLRPLRATRFHGLCSAPGNLSVLRGEPLTRPLLAKPCWTPSRTWRRPRSPSMRCPPISCRRSSSSSSSAR